MLRLSTQAKWLVIQVVGGCALIGALLFYYVAFHVPSRRAAQVERNLRLLADAGRQVETSLSQIQSSLANIAWKAFNPPEVEFKRAGGDETNLATLGPVMGTLIREGVRQVVPRLALETKAELAAKVLPGTNAQFDPVVSVRTVSGLEQAWVTFQFIQTNSFKLINNRAQLTEQKSPVEASSETNRLSNQGITTNAALDFKVRADWREILRPALWRLDFDQLLVLETNGSVIWQQEGISASTASLLRLTRLPELDAASARARTNAAGLLSFASSYEEITLGGVAYLAFAQPLALVLPSGENATNSTMRWMLCGLQRSDRFATEARSLSPPLLIGAIALTLLLVLSWPFLNVQQSGLANEMRFVDVFWTVAASVLGCGALTFLVLDLWLGPVLQFAASRHLRELAHEVESHLRQELKAINQQLQLLNHAAVERYYESELTSLTGLLTSDAALAPTTSPATVYPNLFQVFWMQSDGQQLVKWSMASNTTPFINVRDRDYFRRIAEGRAWAANVAVTNPFFLEPLYLRNRGENVALFSVGNVRVPPATVAALEARPVSLFSPLLPAGYGFCLVDQSGLVLFHPDEGHNLQENFVVECENDERLNVAIRARIEGEFHVRYFQEPRHVLLTPLRDLPWTLVVFRDEQYFGNLNLQVLALCAMLFAFHVALLGLIVLGIYVVDPRHRWDWMWPHRQRRLWHQRIGGGALLLAVVFALLQAQSHSNDWRLFWALALPYAGLLAAWQVLKRVPSERDCGCLRLRTDRTLHCLSLGALLTVLSVLPAAAFFRIAYLKEMELFLQGTQLKLAEDLQSRAERIERELRLTPGSQRIIAARKSSTWDIHEDFFFGTSHSTNLVSDSPGFNARPAIFDEHLNRFRPVVGKLDTGSRALLADAKDQRWKWLRRRTPNELIFQREAEADWQGQPPLAITTKWLRFPAPNWWWYFLAAGAAAVPFGLVHFSARRISLLDVATPMRSPERALPAGVILLDWPRYTTDTIIEDQFLELERNRAVPFSFNDRTATEAVKAMLAEAAAANADRQAVLVLDRCGGQENREELRDAIGSARLRGLAPTQTLVVVTDPHRSEPARPAPGASTPEQRRNAVVRALVEQQQERWNGCSTVEKQLLHQAAHTGFVDARRPETALLLGKGLLRREPRLRLANEILRRYVLHQFPQEKLVIADAGGNYWHQAKGPVAVVLLLLAAFLFVTQREVWNLAIGMIPAFLAGMGLLAKIPGLFQVTKDKPPPKE